MDDRAYKMKHYLSFPQCQKLFWVFPIALLIVFVIRFLDVNSQTLATVEHLASTRGHVIGVAGGDVSLRDVPRACEIARGRFLTDPHYKGEAPWYPAVAPMLAAGMSKLTGRTIPSAYFLTEIWLCAIAILVTAWLLHRLGGWWALGLLPLGLGLNWFPPPSALYPAESARAFFFLLVGILAARWDDAARGRSAGGLRSALVLGLGLGIMGLWHGASFVITSATTGIFVAFRLVQGIRRGTLKQMLAWLSVLVASATIVFGGLFVLPQLIRYGSIHQAGSARLYLAPHYGYEGGTSASEILDLPLFPHGWDLAFFAVFIGSLWSKKDRFRYFKVPLLMAYLVAILMGHLGFAMHDLEHQKLAHFIRDNIPAPPHTFVMQSVVLLTFIKIMAIAALVAWLWSFAKPQWMGIPKIGTVPVAPVAFFAFVALVPLVWINVPRIALAPVEESSEFAGFARAASYIADDETIYINHPFRFISQAGFRLLYFRMEDHANHYVQKEREQAQTDLFNAVKANRLTVANAILDKYSVNYLMRVDGEADPIVNRCGVEILSGPGVALLRRAPCR
jgi:hypothetical protein